LRAGFELPFANPIGSDEATDAHSGPCLEMLATTAPKHNHATPRRSEIALQWAHQNPESGVMEDLEPNSVRIEVRAV
jgi:hypothetical protein